MRTTQRLLRRLYRAFDKDPDQFLALRLTYGGAGVMTWTVADGRLRTQITLGGTVASGLDVDLTGYTLGTLATYLAAQPNYSTPFVTSGQSGLAAVVLLDASGDPSQSNGDHLYGYQSLLWAMLEAWAVDLTAIQTQIAVMPAEMAIPTADEAWLDTLGDQYGIPRIIGETDSAYGPRMIAEILRPRANNIAIEMAIEAFTGQPAACIDYTLDGPLVGGVPKPLYGLFDVTAVYQPAAGLDNAAMEAAVRALIERSRAVGTQLRTLTMSPAGGYRHNSLRRHNGLVRYLSPDMHILDYTFTLDESPMS